MPHVVLAGKVDLHTVMEKVDLSTYREGSKGLIVRFEDIFLNRSQDTVLAKAIVVESGAKAFFVLMSAGEGRTTFRLDPTTDPDKTDGVKTALALLCVRVQKLMETPLEVAQTNIQEFLTGMS